MKKLILIFCFVMMFMQIVHASSSVGWERVAQNNYINPETVIGTEDMYGFMFMLKSYNKGQFEPVNGRHILYTLSQYTIDCGKNKYKIGVIDSYDESDNFINGDYNKYATFQPIISGTAVSAVATKLCRPINSTFSQ